MSSFLTTSSLSRYGLRSSRTPFAAYRSTGIPIRYKISGTLPELSFPESSQVKKYTLSPSTTNGFVLIARLPLTADISMSSLEKKQSRLLFSELRPLFSFFSPHAVSDIVIENNNPNTAAFFHINNFILPLLLLFNGSITLIIFKNYNSDNT